MTILKINKHLLSIISVGSCAKLWDIISGSKILTASFLTYSMLRTLSQQLLSVVTGSYVSGTYSIVFVNCPNEQIARDIARYYWNGEIEEATEILLLIKTKTSKVHMLSSYIRLVHPFEIPEVFSLPMDQGDVHYLKWLEEGMEEE
ncbi:protein CutA homolog isoform X4 [Mesoplodon densirostris]|uniref:protein CutA homolog isoform X4 n=1 Tax=Mesoplodon densirostris TaxID=48708 RepID=UPI0028DCBE14|nr:protein CutA homolog isoform X4 [Mesoplodon densirostris]